VSGAGGLLLDTRVALWALSQPWEIASELRARIASAPRVCVSAASAWEIALKVADGRARVAPGLAQALEAAGMEELPVTIAHAEASRALPAGEGDPFDRLLAAQALLEGLTLVSAHGGMRAYGVPLLLA
jgi:PIN domain nuclease of toxin-antitoxin system